MKKCKGIWSGQPCAFGGMVPDDATGNDEFCPDCYSIGEDLMFEEQAEAREYAQTPRVNPATGWTDVESGASVGPDEPDEFPFDDEPEDLDDHWSPHHDNRDSDEPDDNELEAGDIGFEYPHLSDDNFF